MEIVRLLRKIGGAAAVPIGVIFILASFKTVLDFAGSPGKKIASWRGEGLRKRAQDSADAIDQNREAASIKGGWRARLTRPGARGRQRRALRNQDAQANLEASQAQFGQTDKKAGAYTSSISANKAVSAAASSAANTALVDALARNPNTLNDKLSKDAREEGSSMQEALAVQQERAMAEAIKDTELKAKIQPGDVAEMGRKMVEAIKSGDSIGARAYQNMLMKSGGPGTDQYRKSMGEIGAADMARGADGKMTASGEAVTALKRNMLANHGNIKETAADLIKHASSEEGTTMQSVSDAAGTWGMSNDDLVKQKTHSLAAAASAGGISQKQATEILGDNQLSRRLDKNGRAILERIKANQSVGDAHAEAMQVEMDIAHEEAIQENNRRNGTP